MFIYVSKKWLLFTSLFASITSASASLPISSELEETTYASNHLNLRSDDIKGSSKSSSIISYNDLPLDVLAQIVKYLEKNNLIQFRGVSSTSAKAVESFILKASFIKFPFNCLIDHPYPHTISHFMRDHLRNIFNNGPQTDETYRSLIKFSNEWNYVGKDILEAIVAKDLDNVAINTLKYLTDTTDNPDLRELQLLLRINSLLFTINNVPNSVSFYLNSLLSTARAMPDSEKKEIASPHLFSFAQSLLVKSQLEVTKELYKFCANQGHEDAQNNLGTIFYKEGNISEAKKYYQLAVDQGHAESQFALGTIFYNEGNIIEAKKYLKFAANQGHMNAQFNLGAIFHNQGNMFEAKIYYQLAAEQGNKEAQFHVGNIFYIEGNMVEGKKYCRLAANQGHRGAQMAFRTIFNQ